jgi:hypothetical protein
MCPPFEISGRKKKIIVANRGYFIVSQNKIEYKFAKKTTNFLMLQPHEGLGIISELPSNAELDAFYLLYQFSEDLMDICFFSKTNRSISMMDFFFGDLHPFLKEPYDSRFYELRPLPQSIFEDFNKLAVSLEDTITTTISTFDENVFIPFKQKFVSEIHKKEMIPSTMSTLSRDFPKFFSLHQDLLTILHNQAKQVSENQQLSFSIFNPILRKIWMLKVLQDCSVITLRRKSFGLKLIPKKIEVSVIAEKIASFVEP